MGRLAHALPVLVLVAIGVFMIAPIDDPDFWWLLRGGAYIVETGTFPSTDPFSGTAAGEPWLNHAWGFELLLYAIYRVAGLEGIVLMQAAFATLAFGALYRLLRLEGVSRAWALGGITLGALATHGFWTPRPQLVTYLLLVVFWALLREYRDGRRDRLVWLVPLMVLWVNLHGGFMVGPTLLALVLAGEVVDRAVRARADALDTRRMRRLAGVGAACVAATFVNPFYHRAVLFPFEVLAERLPQAFIIEWASPPFQFGQVVLVEGLVMLTLVLLLRTPRPARASDLIVLVAFFHFALQAVRNIPLLVVILVPILARAMAEAGAEEIALLRPLRELWQRRLAVGVAAAALPVVVLAGYPLSSLDEFLPRFGVASGFPAGAVEYLKRERRSGTLFNDYGWGGYLIWHLYPDYRVSIDGRVAVYGPRRFAEHVEVSDVRPRWRETLDRLGTRLVLIRARSPLAIVLKASPGWTVLYEDRLAVVFAKREAAS
jgi:hypothetical protein